MRVQRLARYGIAATGILGLAYVVIAAGCGGGGSSQPAVPSAGAVVNPTAVCVAGSGGVIYLPDGGTNPHGITVQPFEQTNGSFIQDCAQKFISSSTSVLDLSISVYGDAIALLNNGSDVVGLTGFLSGYVGSPSFTPFSQSAQSLNAQNLTSVVIFPAGTLALAVDQENPSPGPTAGIIGVNNILGVAPNPIPTIAGQVAQATPSPLPNATATAYNPPIAEPGQVAYTAIGVSPSATPASGEPSATPAIYQSTALADPPASFYGRATIALGPDGQTLLLRGDKDLLALQAVTTAGGYYLEYPAVGTTLSTPITTQVTNYQYGYNQQFGYPSTLTPTGFAHGLIAFSPASASHALVGGTTGSSTTSVTLLTEIPSNLVNGTYTYTLPSNAKLTSLAVNPNGNIAAVGTVSGLVILSGVAGTSLSPVPQANFPNGITYTNLKGSATLNKIVSVGFSTDGRFLIVLADNGDSTSSILAFAIDGNGNLSSPLSGSLLPVTLGAPIKTPNDDYMVVH